MSDQCIPLENLAHINDLTENDPLRLHLSNCPRCRSRLASFNEFLDPEPIADTAAACDAESQLTAALNQEIFGSSSSGNADQPIRTEESGLRRFLALLARPALRPAWGFAAGLLLFFVMRGTFSGDGTQPGDRILRGGDGNSISESAISADYDQNGDLLFLWTAAAESDGAEIVFYSSDLTECGRIDGGLGSDRLVTGESLSLEAGTTATFWRVVFTCQGDVIGQTSLESLPTSR
jgi:hypothetical protein